MIYDNSDKDFGTSKITSSSITIKVKENEKNLYDIRKKLNDSTRQAIQLKATNKSSFDKQFEKCSTFQRKVINETNKVKKRVFSQIKEDEGDLVMLGNKFLMLNDDIDRITKLSIAVEARLKQLEMEVGVGHK